MLENEHMATDKIMTKRKYSYLLITAVLSFIVGSLPYIIPFMQNVVLSEEKQMLFKKIEQEKFQKFVDSINDIQDLKTQEQTYRNISTINDLMNGLARELSNSSAISIYYSHDSGGVPVSGSPLNVTILYSADNKEPCLGKSYWQNKPMPEGYFNYNFKLYKEKFLYINEVINFSDIYMKDTKEHLDCNNTKSLMGIVLKETRYGVYYMTASWDRKDPLEQNQMAKLILKKYAAMIAPLIQGKEIR